MKQRSRIIAAVLVSAVLAFFAGFSVGHEEGRKTQPEVRYATTFYATITDVGTQGLEVDGLDINQINFRSLYGFSIRDDTQLVWHGTPVTLNELSPGLTVAVSFTGNILESYPVGLTEVCRVEILDDELGVRTQPVTPVPELSAQETAQRAYEQILGALRPISPAEFADAYYQDGVLVVCLTDASTEMQEKYRLMTNTPHILEFQQVEYSYNDLNDLQNAVVKTKGLVFSSVGIDIKANRVNIGIPDISQKDASLSLIVEQLPVFLKNRFSEYPLLLKKNPL